MADLAQQDTSVRVRAWDYRLCRPISGRSNGSYLRPGSGHTGSQVLRVAIGDRPEPVADFVAADREEAGAMADTVLDRRSRPLVWVEATADSDPALRAGTEVKLSGLGGRFSNASYVVRCRQKYDFSDGYVTDFEAECAFLGAGF